MPNIEICAGKGSLYLKLGDGEVSRTYVASNTVFIDYDIEGEVIGIEIVEEDNGGREIEPESERSAHQGPDPSEDSRR